MNGRLLIGRSNESKRLLACVGSEQAQLIVVYGRRRVGKTYFITAFFDGRFDFKLTGMYNQPTSLQLMNFMTELNGHLEQEEAAPMDWFGAFKMLRRYLESLPDDQNRVVFFDEMPWMDTPRSKFLAAFEWFWNSWGSVQSRLIFIACGSASSWIQDNIVTNKGGLFNRTTCRLFLKPFTLGETEQYLLARGIEWSRYQIAECYMIMGGIPYYLSLLVPTLSFGENIDNMFFRKRAELWDEFGLLYKTLFSNSDAYVKIVEALSKKRSGLSRNEIIEATGLSGNGQLTKMLGDLQASSFIDSACFFGNKKKDMVYRLTDHYTGFYYRFLNGKAGKDEHYWSNSIDNPSRRAWAGLAFEELCKSHIEQIRTALGITGVLTEVFVWSKKGDDETDGAQIDLVLDRRDHVIDLCEIKYSTEEYVIDKDYDKKLRNKIGAFRSSTGTHKALHLVMITTYGVKSNKYSGIAAGQVVLDDLFA